MTDLQAWRDQVAAAVRGVSMTMLGGTCWFRATIGAMALAHLGMRPQRMMGGMIFRAGPDERLDTVPFCGPSNHAQWIGDRPLFHVWLEVDGDIIDFSCGDWKSQELLVEEVSAPGGEQPSRPIRWDVEPPDYIWQPADTLLGERFKAPPLGKIWYARGFWMPKGGKTEAETQAGFNSAAEEVLPYAKMLWPAVKEALPPPLPRPPGRADARRLRQMARLAAKRAEPKGSTSPSGVEFASTRQM